MIDQKSVIVLLAAFVCLVPLAAASAWALCRITRALSEIIGANHRAESFRRHDDHALLERLIERMMAERDHRYQLDQLHAVERRQQQDLDGRAARLQAIAPHLGEQAAARNMNKDRDEYEDGIPTEHPEDASHE